MSFTEAQAERAARRLAYDVWPFATAQERQQWSDVRWLHYLTAARGVLTAAFAAPSEPTQELGKDAA